LFRHGSILLFFGGVRSLLVTAAEFFYPSGSIDNLLLSSKEWMASRTDFDVELGFGGTGFKSVAASAGNNTLYICRMDFFFHFTLL